MRYSFNSHVPGRLIPLWFFTMKNRFCVLCFLSITPVLSFANTCHEAFSSEFASIEIKQKREQDILVAKRLLEEYMRSDQNTRGYDQYVRAFQRETGLERGIARWFAYELGYHLNKNAKGKIVLTPLIPIIKMYWSPQEKLDVITKIITDAGGEIEAGLFHQIYNRATRLNHNNIKSDIKKAGFTFKRKAGERSYIIYRRTHTPARQQITRWSQEEKMNIAAWILEREPNNKEYYSEFTRITGLGRQSAYLAAKRTGHSFSKQGSSHDYEIRKQKDHKIPEIILSYFPEVSTREDLILFFLEHNLNSQSIAKAEQRQAKSFPAPNSITSHFPTFFQDIGKMKRLNLNTVQVLQYFTNNVLTFKILDLMVKDNVNRNNYKQRVKNIAELQDYPNPSALDKAYDFSFLKTAAFIRNEIDHINRTREDIVIIRFPSNIELIFDYHSIDTELAPFFENIQKNRGNKKIKVIGYKRYLKNRKQVRDDIEKAEKVFLERHSKLPPIGYLVTLFARFNVNRHNYSEKIRRLPELKGEALPNHFGVITKRYPTIEYLIAYKHGVLYGKRHHLFSSIGLHDERLINIAIQSLTPIQQQILRMRHDLGEVEGYYTLREIGQYFNHITRERVRQIEEEALSELKK